MPRRGIKQLPAAPAGELDSLVILPAAAEAQRHALTGLLGERGYAKMLEVLAAGERSSAVTPAMVGAPPAPAPVKHRQKKEAPKFLQETDLAALFRVIKDVRDRAIFRLAYHAGLRASEVGMLDIRDWNPRTDRIFVHRLKGSNSGEHPLCREEARALRAWLKKRGEAPGIIFPSRKGAPISRQMLDLLMKKYGRLAGLPRELRHFHVLKHSCATHLLSKGFHVEQVQDWIGHANIQNTMIYAKLTNSRRDEMADKLRDTW